MVNCTLVLRSCFSCVMRRDLTPSYATDAAIQKIACAALSIFSGAAGTLLLGLVIAKALPVGCLALGIPLVLLAIGSYICGARIRDYDSPEEVKQMRAKAKNQSYSELISEHGAGPWVIHYSLLSAEAFMIQKGIVSGEELLEKRAVEYPHS